ncbi:MAG: hypothetical protein J5582_00625 [Ruminococcus sp.]|uniref:hypothetical protein n=1 Tax=Ruminococcus sp. TaxID=41978 RepID=UPI0025ECC06B|nr:hypothetical protein [Ruminococcus sp.]MBO4865063.1 hypothetical protein [Ruminococcus sp.]
MDEIKEVNVVKCPKGHLYPANMHRTCPFCIEEANNIKRQEARKKANQRELHINTKEENAELWFDKYFGTLISVIVTTLKIITAPIRLLIESGYENQHGEWRRGTSYSERMRRRR